MITNELEHCNVIVNGDEEGTSGKHKNRSPDILSKIQHD